MEDVPRYWNLERYPGKYVAIDMRLGLPHLSIVTCQS